MSLNKYVRAVFPGSFDPITNGHLDVIHRGLRNLTDVQYEFQLALTNRAVGGLETMFIMTGEKFGFTTSTLIREVGRYGGDVSGLIPPSVYKRLKEKLAETRREL